MCELVTSLSARGNPEVDVAHGDSDTDRSQPFLPPYDGGRLGRGADRASDLSFKPQSLSRLPGCRVKTRPTRMLECLQLIRGRLLGARCTKRVPDTIGVPHIPVGRTKRVPDTIGVPHIPVGRTKRVPDTIGVPHIPVGRMPHASISPTPRSSASPRTAACATRSDHHRL